MEGREFFERVYGELRALARQRMAAERSDHTLQATALVHEAYLRLEGNGYENRAHFFHAAARAMRQILVEHARARGRVKRGGDVQRVSVDLSLLAAETEPAEILALDEAIARLEEEDEDAAAIVRLRFFAGLDVDETALALGISRRTVLRERSYARAWLYRALKS